MTFEANAPTRQGSMNRLAILSGQVLLDKKKETQQQSTSTTKIAGRRSSLYTWRRDSI
jgi:hypothetical protein